MATTSAPHRSKLSPTFVMLSSLIAMSALVLEHVVRDNLEQIAIQVSLPQAPLLPRINQIQQDEDDRNDIPNLPNILDITIPYSFTLRAITASSSSSSMSTHNVYIGPFHVNHLCLNLEAGAFTLKDGVLSMVDNQLIIVDN